MNIACACGSTVLFAIRPGHDAVHEHPQGLFGLPDLQQTPVVTTPEVPDVAWCAEHWPWKKRPG
jgi:hypothetical protein